MSPSRSTGGSKRRKLTLGDVFEVETASGLGYFQYVGKSTKYCELIRVFPGTHPERPASFDEILSEHEAFMTFYPIPRALYEGLVTWVHHEEPPDRFRIFPMMRSGTAIPPSGGPRKWRLFDGEHSSEFQEMTAELSKPSVAATAGHAWLVNKIEIGYRPEDEV